MKLTFITINKKYCIYSLDHNWKNDLIFLHQNQFSQIDFDLVDRFFSDDDYRKALFNKFLNNNHIGYLLYCKDDWVNYTWVSPPGAKINFHLPLRYKANSNYWIFFCRTNGKFQKKGYYTISLKLLCNSLIKYHKIPRERIYIDAESESIPAIKAITKAGFIWKKNVYLTTIRIPRLLNIKIAKDEEDNS